MRYRKVWISIVILLVIGSSLSITLFFTLRDKKESDIVLGNILDISDKTNLIPNPSFETGTYGSLLEPSSWFIETGNAEINWIDNETIALQGSKCMRISNSYNEEGWELRPKIYTDLVNLNENMSNYRYLFRIWSKTSQEVEEGELFIAISYYDKNGIRLAGDNVFCLPSSQWQATNFIMETIPASATQFRVFIQLDNSRGTAWFDCPFICKITQEEYYNCTMLGRFQAPTITTGLPQGSTSSITHLEKINDCWWLVDPDGTPFWSTGPSSIEVYPETNPYLWENLGQPNSEELQIIRDEMKVTAKKEFGFNTNVKETSGSNTDHYIMWLNMGTEAAWSEAEKWIMRDAEGNGWGSNGAHIFPDPFDEDWETYVQAIADLIPEWFLARPDCIGYWTDNEMNYGATWNYIWNNACSTVFIQWLQGIGEYTNSSEYDQPPNGYYSSIAELNAAWSSSLHTYTYTNFSEIAGANKPKIRGWEEERLIDDFYAFERVIYQKYVTTVINSIRSREASLGYPHRLIISNRWGFGGPSFFGDTLTRVMDIFGQFDIIGVNAYPYWNRDRDHYSYEYLQFMEEVFYRKTQRPILIAEFGFAAVDAGIEVARWRPITLDTQKQRGIAYQNIISTLANMPWTVGAHFFTYTNGYFLQDGVTPDPRNCGLVDDFNEPYEDLISKVKSTNQQINTCSRNNISVDDLSWSSLNIIIIDDISSENNVMKNCLSFDVKSTNDTFLNYRIILTHINDRNKGK